MTKKELTFSEALAQARRAAGLTAARLAQELGVARRTVVRWEAGAMPAHDTQLALLRVLAAREPRAMALVARALGFELDPGGRAAAPVSGRWDARLDGVVRAEADRLDIKASELRAVLAALLDEVSASGISLREASHALRARSR